MKTIFLLSSLCCFSSQAAVLTNVNVDFNEAAFPSANGTALTGTNNYNLFNDTTGAKLATLNGDADDITIAFASNGAQTGWDWSSANSGGLRASQGFTGSVPVNNPGTRVSNTLTLTFAEHLTVTDFIFDVSSANSSGIAWEFTIFELLQTNGTPFSFSPVISAYNDHTSFNGSPSVGVFITDSKGTVSGVGSANTSSGVSGIHNNFSNTGDLSYADFGLAAGTQIGGLRMTSFLEDVRGTGNGNTGFSSTLIDFTVSGSIDPVPEPSSVLYLSFASLALLARRKRQA